MGTETKPQSLQALLDTVPNVVDYLYRNPPKTSVNVFSVMMPAEVVRPEYTTWRDEQRSWRETVALHDQSYHMQNLYVRGRDALRLFERLGVNTFKTFAPGAAKQFLACSPEGYVIGDGILYYLDAETLLLVGNPSTTDWAQFNAERGGFDVSVELDPDVGHQPGAQAQRLPLPGRGAERVEAAGEAQRRAAARDQVLPLGHAQHRRLPGAGDAPQHGRRAGPGAVRPVGRPRQGQVGAGRDGARASACAGSARSPTSAP